MEKKLQKKYFRYDNFLIAQDLGQAHYQIVFFPHQNGKYTKVKLDPLTDID